MRKTMTYTNDTGASVTFGHAPFYFERFDACSIDAVISAQRIIGRPGQVTTDKSMPGRTITADLAVAIPDRKRLHRELEKIIAAFDPMHSGLLTIRTETGVYEIECSPMAQPLPEKTAVWYDWKFSVKLMADFPYFRKPGKIIKNEYDNDGWLEFMSNSPVLTPFKAVIPATYTSYFTLENNYTKQELYIINPTSSTKPELTLDTWDLSLKDSDGNDHFEFVNVSSGVAFTDFYIAPGKNKFHLNTPGNIPISFYEYVVGVT